MAERRRVLLVGGGDLAEEVREALDAGGAGVTWLEHADDEPLREAVAAGPDVVCVATRDDAFPLSAACFTGGLINRLVDSRLTGLIGKRAVPRRNHVVVVGLGQVGLRLCMLLRECGVMIVAIDADEDSETVGLARRLQIPVVIGRAANPELLRRLSLGSARAFAAVTNTDLANLESALTARSIHDGLRIVLRAGDGDVSEETRSLERVGHVVDVHRLAAAYIAGAALGSDADSVALRDGRAELLLPGGVRETSPLEVAR